AGGDRHADGAGRVGGGFERRLVPVYQEHLRTAECRSHGVPAGAARQVEHPHARTEPVSMPGEPGTGPGGGLSGWNGQGKRSSRRATLEGLASERADLLVIGGGITGAGIARDAAMRGLSTILVEQHDLGSGTSSRSSRL